MAGGGGKALTDPKGSKQSRQRSYISVNNKQLIVNNKQMKFHFGPASCRDGGWDLTKQDLLGFAYQNQAERKRDMCYLTSPQYSSIVTQVSMGLPIWP